MFGVEVAPSTTTGPAYLTMPSQTDVVLSTFISGKGVSDGADVQVDIPSTSLIGGTITNQAALYIDAGCSVYNSIQLYIDGGIEGAPSSPAIIVDPDIEFINNGDMKGAGSFLVVDSFPIKVEARAGSHIYGGGGQGGAGGKGGNGDAVASLWSTETYSDAVPKYIWANLDSNTGAGGSHFWNDTPILAQGVGYIYRLNVKGFCYKRGVFVQGDFYKISQAVGLEYGVGGDGGVGGPGKGYNASQGLGSVGAAGTVRSGQGGSGGSGGDWGSAGFAGSSGASGKYYTVLSANNLRAGDAGVSGGAAGYALFKT